MARPVLILALMKVTKALGIVGTLMLALASAACGGDENEGEATPNGAVPTNADDPSAESGKFELEAPSSAVVRRSTGGRIDLRVSGASNLTYEIEGLPPGIVQKEHSDASINLSFGGGEPAFGEHAIKVRAKSGTVTREQALTLIVADDPGTLDVTFGQKGLASSIASLVGTSIAVDAAGRTVVAGVESNTGKMFVSRFLPNGTPDTQLDGDGTVTLTFDPTMTLNVASSLALGADGSIVVGGMGGVEGGLSQACLAKLDAKGAPVSGFGKDGRTCVKSPLVSGFTMVNDLVQLADGAVIMTGMTQTATGTTTYVAKLTAAGARDESFATGGIAKFTETAGSIGQGVAVDKEGRILVAGAKVDPVSKIRLAFVLRLDKAGNADPWFGSGGTKLIDRGASLSQANAIAFGPNGEIFVAGQEEKKAVIIALDPEKGEPLASFGTKAGVTFGVGDDASLQHIAWDDGKLVAVGGSTTGSTGSPMVVRVSPNGAPDNTFGQAGSMTLPGESARGIALTPSSRAVVLIATPTGFMVARAWR